MFESNRQIAMQGLAPRSHSVLVLAMAGFLFGMPAAAQSPARPAAVESVTVEIDYARVVRLPEKVQTIIVGNPSIADVSVQKNGVMVVTGKAYGATNLIALDAAGNMLVDTTIRVQAPRDAVVTVHRGTERESYSCTPTCEPSVVLGDVQRFFGEAVGQTTARNGLAGGRAGAN